MQQFIDAKHYSEGRPTPRSLKPSAMGLLLLTLPVVGALFLSSHFQALAQPAAETTALSVAKTVSKTVAAPGETLTYSIWIQETGTQVALQMTDVLPSAVTYVPSSLEIFGPGSAGYSGGTVTWNGTLGFGATAIITFSVQIPSESTATQVVNVAQVTGGSQPVTDSVQTSILCGASPTSQIWDPANGATVTRKGTVPISGVAWDATIPRPFPGDVTLLPISNFGGGGTYNVQWTAAISAQNYVLQESTDTSFGSPTTYSTSETTYLISGKGLGTYYYRVRAYNAEARPGRWSNVQSVVVSQLLQVPSSPAGLAAMPEPNTPVESASDGQMTVWVRIDAGAWQTATVTANAGGWWDWTYGWSAPDENGVAHTIHTRARDGVANLSAIDTITVTLRNQGGAIPYPPVLKDIQNSGGNYTVEWTYDHTDVPVTTYTLQEATDAAFTANVINYSTSGMSYPFTGKTGITYYYRVRGNNEYGPGEWSNVKSVSLGFYDDFSNSSSGWPVVAKRVIPETNSYYRLRYENGQYRIMIDAGGPQIWFHQPDALAPYRPPSDKYCVETRVRIVKGEDPYEPWGDNAYPYWANGGLICGANEANSDIYALCTSIGDNQMGWFVAHNPAYKYPMKGCNYLDNPGIGQGAGALDITKWHLFQVCVNGDYITIHIDGIDKGTYRLGGLSSTTRVGLIGGDYEVTPVDYRFDDFKVIPDTTGVGHCYVYLPAVLRNYRTWDAYYEENDHWLDAYGPLVSGRAYLAYPDDVEDYYYFVLSAPATVNVSVTDFAPTSSNGTVMLYGPATGSERGNLIDYYGPPGDSSMPLGPRSLGPGKYYVRVYTNQGHSTAQLYRLTVTY